MFATPCLNTATYALMGPTMSKLKNVENYAKKVIEKNNLKVNVYSTIDRREALKDANYVIITLKVGGERAEMLAAKASLTGDMELAFSAISMDPLTSSVLTLT